MSDMIEVKDIKRGFPTGGGEVFWALNGISLTVPEGKLTILRGRSGSGKTTLMNILGLLDDPTEGTIFFDGVDLTRHSALEKEKIRRKQIGFVFQSVALIPMMTAFENVDFALRLAKYEGDRAERTMECLRLVGLANRADHMPAELSGGEQQRVAIARAIAHKPKVLFADEPTAELDTNTALTVVKIFRELTEREGITIVMTTHDVGLMELGDLVYELEDGERVG
ncbi:MAG: ABC transporter ATP-binding protein [Firmicutes bacterium]|nr:ABC transporter ATP-binding protein [Bacillota bacterium]